MGGAKPEDVEDEQCDDEGRRLGKIEEAKQEADDQPRQERRTHSAIKISAKQRCEGQKLNSDDRRPLQIAGPFVDER